MRCNASVVIPCRTGRILVGCDRPATAWIVGRGKFCPRHARPNKTDRPLGRLIPAEVSS